MNMTIEDMISKNLEKMFPLHMLSALLKMEKMDMPSDKHEHAKSLLTLLVEYAMATPENKDAVNLVLNYPAEWIMDYEKTRPPRSGGETINMNMTIEDMISNRMKKKVPHRMLPALLKMEKMNKNMPSDKHEHAKLLVILLLEYALASPSNKDAVDLVFNQSAEWIMNHEKKRPPRGEDHGRRAAKKMRRLEATDSDSDSDSD